MRKDEAWWRGKRRLWLLQVEVVPPPPVRRRLTQARLMAAGCDNGNSNASAALRFYAAFAVNMRLVTVVHCEDVHEPGLLAIEDLVEHPAADLADESTRELLLDMLLDRVPH